MIANLLVALALSLIVLHPPRVMTPWEMFISGAFIGGNLVAWMLGVAYRTRDGL